VGAKGKVVDSQPQIPVKIPTSSGAQNLTPRATNKKSQQTPSKKKTSVSSNLDETVWRLLNFLNTLVEGIKRMLMWPVITTRGIDGRRLYLSYLQGDLHPTKVSLSASAGQTPTGIRQLWSEQLQCDMKLIIGS
jgi:hypothetical protein